MTIIPGMIGLYLFLLVAVFLMRNSRRSPRCFCNCMSFTVGIVMILGGTTLMLQNFDTIGVFGFMLGIYSLLVGILLVSVDKEHKGFGP